MSNSLDISLCVAQDPAYEELKRYLIARTGLAFYDDRDELLMDLISRRLSELGLRDCSSYSKMLADGEDGRSELDTLIAKLTIGETYFFRDRQQFDAIRDVILPEIIDRKKSSKQLRIWSAGCANGAEPYSLAILLEHELAHLTKDWLVEIIASDINRQCLIEAAEGKFGEWAFRSTPEEVKRQCFSPEAGRWLVRPEYKKRISFLHWNLVEGEFPSPVHGIAGFDLILCRNVMIYFAPETTRRLIRQFHASLAGGGWFLVGAVEPNVENFNDFRKVDAAGTTLYHKLQTRPPAFAAEPGQSSTPSFRPLAVHTGSAPPPAPAETVRLDIDGLRRLADRGDWANAVRYAHRLLAQDKLNPAAHFYQAMVLEHTEKRVEAQRSLRHAIYLDRKFAMAHYCLGVLLKRENNLPKARHSFDNVLQLLSGLGNEQQVPHGNGVTVAGLKAIAKTHLDERNEP